MLHRVRHDAKAQQTTGRRSHTIGASGAVLACRTIGEQPTATTRAPLNDPRRAA
ncbi:MAG: hypothetical protein ABFD03_04370 [Clostridiaceae bacterium]